VVYHIVVDLVEHRCSHRTVAEEAICTVSRRLDSQIFYFLLESIRTVVGGEVVDDSHNLAGEEEGRSYEVCTAVSIYIVLAGAA
jgi:hypothetical protein